MKKNSSEIKSLKVRQKEIIDHIIRFRYLNTNQLQILLKHKSKSKIKVWLADLSNKKYLFKYYQPLTPQKPSIYCLDTVSKSYIKEKNGNEKILRRIYKDKHHSEQFRIHTIFLADIYLSLQTLTNNNQATLHFYTKTDLQDEKYLILPHPDCYFAIEEKDQLINRYFLDIFDDKSFVYKRVQQYFTYYKKKYWDAKMKKPFPKILFICPNVTTKKKAQRYILRKQRSPGPQFYIALTADVQKYGLCREVLQEVI